MIITQSGPQNVQQAQMFFEGGDLFLSPDEYQRESAWGFPQKQLLIDTIFRNMDIPKFYFWKIDDWTLVNGYPDGDTKTMYRQILDRKRRENDDPSPFVYEVVDGQQRIRTILEFMGVQPPNKNCYRGAWHQPYDSMSDTPIAKGKSYRTLNPEQKITFGMCKLTIMVLEQATMSEIRDMFLRLQNGTPLNAQQKRDAIGATINRPVREISRLPFFTTSVNFGGESAEHHRVAAQMLLLEDKEKIVSCTSQQLDKFFANHKDVDLERKVFGRTRMIVSMLGKIFPSKNPALNRSYVLCLYWSLSRILLTYNIKEEALPKVRDNFEQLDQRRLEAMNREYSETDDEVYQRLSDSMSRGTDGSERITSRYEILTEYIFDGIELSPHPELDPNRNFSYEEKLILYRRANGLCQLECNGVKCNRSVEFEDGVVDHVLPHSKGGSTSLQNGRYAHKTCNISRGIRDDFDPTRECYFITSKAADIIPLTEQTAPL